MITDLIPFPSTQRSLSRFGADPMVGFRKAMDRLFEDFTSDFDEIVPASWSRTLQSFTPKLDLEERDDKIVLTAELPGLTDKDVQVEVNKDYLTVKGEKKSVREEKDKNNFFSERSYGSFERTIRLPSEIIKDKIDAAVKDGILTVTLPKSPEAKKDVKKIPVHH